MPIAIENADEISISLKAELSAVDGNLARTFEEIDAFAKDLQTRTSFTDVLAVQYPFEADTQSAVSGEVDADREENAVQFELRLTYVIPRTQHLAGASADDRA